MASWTNDGQLHLLMRAYLATVGRLEQAVADGTGEPELEQLRSAKRAAAQAYESALLSRGWRIPGLAVGPLARAARW